MVWIINTYDQSCKIRCRLINLRKRSRRKRNRKVRKRLVLWMLTIKPMTAVSDVVNWVTGRRTVQMAMDPSAMFVEKLVTSWQTVRIEKCYSTTEKYSIIEIQMEGARRCTSDGSSLSCVSNFVKQPQVVLRIYDVHLFSCNSWVNKSLANAAIDNNTIWVIYTELYAYMVISISITKRMDSSLVLLAPSLVKQLQAPLPRTQLSQGKYFASKNFLPNVILHVSLYATDVHPSDSLITQNTATKVSSPCLLFLIVVPDPYCLPPGPSSAFPYL